MQEFVPKLFTAVIDGTVKKVRANMKTFKIRTNNKTVLNNRLKIKVYLAERK